MIQMQEPSHHKRLFQKRILIPGILLLLISGVIVWILNAIGLFLGPWSNILLIVFTGLGVIIPLLLWWWSSPVGIVSETQSPSFVQQHLSSIQAHLGVSKRKGALIVKVEKTLRGATVYLYRGFDRDDLHPDKASNIILRKIDGSLTCIALFTALEPGNYTILVSDTELKTNVTIQAGQVAEIDWQCPRGKKSAVSKRRWRLW
jgi:hypothetical protein